ncbi:MAG: phosphatase PAP2 family protein [Alphaproteobacteria bacterium]|nr:phosphatase PAP2 family protein [Alphaproteobacteria bacterium]
MFGIKNLHWLWIIFWAAVTVALVVAGVFWFDVPVYNYLRGFNCAAWGYVGDIFSVKSWMVLSAIVVVAFYIRKMIEGRAHFRLSDMVSRIRSSYAFWVFCSVFCASAIGVVLKIVLGRARPVLAHVDTYGFFPFTVDWAFWSMPSGHTMASFAGLVMIGMVAPRVRWVMWLLATVIGVSRVCAGFHWPSDVILGVFIGIVSAYMVKRILQCDK